MKSMVQLANEYSKKYHKSFEYSMKKVKHYNIILNKRKRMKK